MAQTKDAATKIVQAALRSDRDFETYKPQIIQKIKASDDVMIKATVDTVKKYLKDKKKEGFSKLTALMLLKECMDTKNKSLVEYVHTKILRRLGLVAQGKDKCLPKDTSAALVQLFSQLLRECIVVWNDWFGYDSKKNPTKYKKTHDAVFAKVEKPTKLVHFTKPEAAEDRVLPQSINQSEVRSDNGRSPYQNLEASRPGISDKPVAERDDEEDERPKKKFEIKKQEDPFVEKMTALMKHIKGNKEMLYEQMAISEEPDSQGVKMILQNLIKANQQLADNWDELEAKEFPTKDEIADQAVLDNEVIEELVTEYNKMVKKEITMEDYRVFVIRTLSDPAKNGPEGLQLSQQKPSEVSKGQALSPAVQNRSSAATPVQVQAQAQSQSQSQSQQKPQQNDGFDLDAFEEASPELRQQQQAEEQARAAKLAQEKAQRERERNGAPVRDTGIAGPPDRRAPAQASVGGSQASEGGTRKAPRNFRDLFNNDPKDSRGRKAGTGSRRGDKSNLDDSKGSVGFGKSWDVNPQGQGQSQRNRTQQQQQNKGQQGGFGVDDFDDLPAADPTGSYDDTSNMSADSRTYDFNYDRSRAVDKSRSRLDPRDQQKAAPMFSPSGNVLPPNEEGFNIRGTRKATPSPGYERRTAQDIDDALYEAEKYETTGGYNQGTGYNQGNNQGMGYNQGANQGGNMNRGNTPQGGSRNNLTVDTESANRKYEQRNTNVNVQQQQQQQNNNRPSDGNGNFGFGNPFGGEDNENNNNMAQSAGFGQPNLQVNGVPQEANINASRRNTPVSSQKQQPPPPQQQRNQPGPPQQQQQQQRNQQGMNNSIPFTQSVMAPTVTGQNARFAPIERPSFLNTLGTNTTINVSTFEGPAMRQADDLLERARRLTSQSRPPSHIDTRPQNMRTSVSGGNYPVPASLDHQYQPIPPLFSAETVGIRPSLPDPMMRRSSLERVGPYVSSTFNNAVPLVNSAVLNQSGNVGGDGFLREIERAREQSKAIAAKYSSPGSRRQSDSGLISNLAVAAALQGTASSNLASAVLQGPSKYTNGDSSAVLNTSVRIETEMRQSHYSQYGSKARSPRKEDDSVTFVGGAERTSIRDTGRGLATERSEKLSRGYGTAKFPEAGEGKEMTRAAQLIEKARRLREESRQRKTFAGDEIEKKEYLYQTPSRLGEVSHMKESSYLDNRREERPMKASQVEVRYVNRMEDGHATAPQTFYGNRYENNYDNVGPSAVNIRSRDVQISQYSSRGRQNETPVRLVGPDGAIYQEVKQGYGIGRKPSEEPRRSAYVANVGRDSPLTADMVRGRSRETRHETLGQWRHQQQEFGVGMRESRVDMKRSAYHEAKELLENSRRQNDVSAHAERRGRFENMSPERLQKTRSPLRERQEKVQEAVELKANETLRIVERPVPGGAAGRNVSRSPAPRGSVTANSLKSSLNMVPPPSNVATGVQQGKATTASTSSKLANEIKSQLNALKQSLVGRREKSDSVSSKATLQLDGSSNSVPQIATIQRERERGPIIVQREEVKVQEKVGIRVDNRDLMGQYNNRVGDREMKRSAAVPVENVNMRVERRESDTTPAITPYGTDEGFSRRLNVKEISAVQGVKLTMDDSNVWEEESTVRTRNLDESLRRDREREYRELVGPSYNKPKVGRAVHFDYYLFDQITNAIFANGQGKDVDVFKASCLQNKAVLFDSPKLKIDVITRMEDEEGRTGGKKLKVILHYVNKSNESITGFIAEILENSIVQNPRINGNNLPPKYQLKQELYLDFSNFKNLCYTIMITYQHEGFPYSAKVPLPLSVNKFMKLKMVHQGEYKRQWKNLKGGSVKSKYKHINAKFIRDHTEVNKYFDNCLVDVTPTLNPKRKRKYGGVFVLPDGSEHYLRITLDTSRVKFAVASNTNGSQAADWVVQYLSYLLTV